MSEQLTLVFFYEGKSVTIQCQETDKIDDIFNRYCVKAGLSPEDTKFYYNSREVKRCGKTLFALGIGNRGTFNVVLSKYVVGA